MKILKVRKDEVKNEFFYDVKICGKKFENVKAEANCANCWKTSCSLYGRRHTAFLSILQCYKMRTKIKIFCILFLIAFCGVIANGSTIESGSILVVRNILTMICVAGFLLLFKASSNCQLIVKKCYQKVIECILFFKLSRRDKIANHFQELMEAEEVLKKCQNLLKKYNFGKKNTEIIEKSVELMAEFILLIREGSAEYSANIGVLFEVYLKEFYKNLALYTNYIKAGTEQNKEVEFEKLITTFFDVLYKKYRVEVYDSVKKNFDELLENNNY